MIRRVFLNQHNVITLDSDMFGSRKRLSTGKKSDKRLIHWYEKHFDEEYEKLYNEKFENTKQDDYSDATLRTYGKIILDLTSDRRRPHVQKRVMEVFDRICNFKMFPDKNFGEMRLADIKSMHIMRWQKECNWAYQTIVANRAYLNMVLETAANDDIIRKNPISTVRFPPKREVHSKTFYDEDDIKELIRKSGGQLRNYIQLCAFTGMRGSELLALKWEEDIDFTKGIIRVASRIYLGEEGETKSGKIRYIPMFPQARQALLNQRMRSGLRKYVFINRKGDYYQNTEVLNRMFKRFIQKHNLKHGTIHDLRRSFNTLLKQHGYPIDFILDIMGHVDDKVNREHYTGHLKVDLSKIAGIAL